MNTLDTLQEMLVRDHHLRPDQVTPDARLADLGIDSLALVELMFQCEDRFGIEVPLGNPEDLQTLGDVARFVDRLASPGAAGGAARCAGAGARAGAGPVREQAPPASPAGP
ncbi:MAG: acyl carrier protein [Steroidobacteraceae bacterium]|jgi:acyl carrier protein|nr:acyl carrier protein [Steroidobacteraceae bacterium]